MAAGQALRVLLTGSAGFIGFHLAQRLLASGARVHGYDGLTDYYDTGLKRARNAILLTQSGFSWTEAILEQADTLDRTVEMFRPDIIVHLAAQAGVRYSLEKPRAYVDSNIIGSFNILETARRAQVRHLLMASTSSVYGANTSMPYSENDKADTPMSFYAATKKATEAMAHSWAHLHSLPITMFRFFTVYGPWGRPDMAPSKFARNILVGTPIDIYNHGNMWRDFTYVEDLARAIELLMSVIPGGVQTAVEGDSLSPVAPFRIVNIGNSTKVRLDDFVAALEAALGVAALRNYMPIQPGDVPATWADASLLQRLTGYMPATDIRVGLAAFAQWYRSYYTHGVAGGFVGESLQSGHETGG